MQNSSLQFNWIQKRCLLLFLGLSSVLQWLLFVPLKILESNPNIFFPSHPHIHFCIVITAVACSCFSILAFTLKLRSFEKISWTLWVLSFFGYLVNLISPLNFEMPDDIKFAVSDISFRIFSEILILILCMFWFLYRKKLLLLSFSFIFSLISLSSSSYRLFTSSGSLFSSFEKQDHHLVFHKNRAEDLVPLSSGLPSKVFWIVFDGFHRPILSQILKENPERKRSFVGFYHFSRHRSNYMATRYSLTSILTGKPIPRNLKIDFMNDRFEGAPFNQFKSLGYVGYFFSHEYIFPQYFQHYYHATNLLPGVRKEREKDLSLLLVDISLMHFIPQALLRFIGKGPPLLSLQHRFAFDFFSDSSFNQDRALALQADALFHQLLESPAVTGQQPAFVFAHINLPHSPFVFRTNGEHFDTQFIKGDLLLREYEQSNYVTKLAAKLIERLRENKTYDESLIIFTSDHGSDQFGRSFSSENRFPEDMGIKGDSRYSAEKINHRTQAILLVKPPYLLTPDNPELVVRNVLTQGMDILPTVLDFLKIESDDNSLPGVNVFKLKENNDRTIKVYAGLKPKTRTGRNYFDKVGTAQVQELLLNEMENWQVNESVLYQVQKDEPND